MIHGHCGDVQDVEAYRSYMIRKKTVLCDNRIEKAEEGVNGLTRKLTLYIAQD